MRSPRKQPLAVSSYDIPGDQEMLVYSCEDCACPVSGRQGERQPEPAELPTGALVRSADVAELPLRDGWSVAFGPHGDGGAVVVDDAASRLLGELREPQTVAELVAKGWDRTAVEATMLRLLQHDLVHPPGVVPSPRFEPSRELTAWLHVTNACNLRCPYCYVAKTKDAMDHPTARATIDSLVDSAVRHGFKSLRLKFAGGEATLNTDVLFAMYDQATVRCGRAGLEFRSVLLSNGVAISSELASDLKSRGIAVMISLDGIGAAHDAQRPTVGGRPSSAMVEESVDRLIDAGVAPHISITITGRNAGELAPVVEFALDRDLTFSFNIFRDNDCAAGFDDLQYEESAMINGLLAAFAVVERRLPRWSVLGAVLDRGQLLRPRQQSCGVGDDYVVVDQAGQIAKCHMEIKDTIGHVTTTDPVLAIRTNTTGLRNLLVEDKEGCRTCSWRHWCSGGCSAATFRATGRFDVRSPNCRIYKTIYPEALRLEGHRILEYSTAPARRADT